MAGGISWDATAAHARLLRDGGVQFELAQPQDPLGPWLAYLAPVLKVIGPGLGWFLLAVLLLVPLFGVYLLVRSLLKQAPVKPSSGPELRSEDRPEPLRARAFLEEADRLASQGRFGEAVRVLLHRSLDDIRDRRPRALPKSSTAREIAVSPDLSAEARICFGEIAAAVEVFAFAGRAVTAPVWERCRAAYARFALPELWTQG